MKSVIDHLIVFLAGASIMLIELVGARMLAPVFGTGMFVWASLLTVVLAALTAGYFLGGVLSRKIPALEARHLLLAAAILMAAAELARGPVLQLAGQVYRRRVARTPRLPFLPAPCRARQKPERVLRIVSRFPRMLR